MRCYDQVRAVHPTMSLQRVIHIVNVLEFSNFLHKETGLRSNLTTVKICITVLLRFLLKRVACKKVTRTNAQRRRKGLVFPL